MTEFVLRIPTAAGAGQPGDGGQPDIGGGQGLQGQASGFVLRVPTGRGQQQPQQPVSAADRVLTSIPGRILKGASAVIDGGAEMLPHALGNVVSLGGMAPNAAADWLFDESRRVRQMNADNEAAYQAARQRVGQEGFDGARLAGNVGSGVLTGVATGGSMPATLLGRAAYGAGVGGASAALAPTNEPDDRKFGEQKAAQTVMGAVVGAAATPAIGALTDRIGKIVDRMLASRSASKMSDAMIADRMRFELAKDGIDINDLPGAMRQRIADEVRASLRTGQQLDPASLARKMDMESFGGGTAGQITRDPVQWVSEYNLRQVGEAGRPLVEQAQRVRDMSAQRLSGHAGGQPTTAYERGAQVIESLQRANEPVSQMVKNAYDAARASAGRDARFQPWQFAQTANDLIDAGNLGGVLPPGVRSMMNRVATGEVPLTVDVASQMQSVLSAQARMLRQAGNREGALAVDQVSRALRETDLESSAGEGARAAFNEAKRLAAAQFATRKAAPAYDAAIKAANDPLKFPPEKFIDQHVVRASQDSVRNLSEVLPADGAAAVRQHLVTRLQEAAFGSNASGGAPFAVERYMQALNGIGREKLKMFMPDDVVDDLFRIGRVNAYATQAPVGSVPNRSGTAAALTGILQRVPGIGLIAGVGREIQSRAAVEAALSAQVPTQVPAVVAPALRQLLPAVAVGVGMTQ